jgi:predicted transcriptional regulator of viral defense system
MKFDDLLRVSRKLPLIESANLSALNEDPRALAVQLSRWAASGKLLRLTRGIYLLAKQYRSKEPALEYVANLLVRPSFVSREYALAFHGLIPEAPKLVTNITTGRPVTYTTPIGEFDYRHLGTQRFFGYLAYSVSDNEAWIATPERALLDVVYFSKGEHTKDRIEQLRLQQLEKLDPSIIAELAERFHSPKVSRAARRIVRYLKAGLAETFEL